MCVIIIGKINQSMYDRAERENPDGVGFLTAASGIVKRPDQATVNEYINDFGIWHFRIGTGGRKDEYNIHPFVVCHGEYALFHNGIISSGIGDKSDTHLLGDFLEDADLETAKTVLNSIIKRNYGNGNKFVLANIKNPKEYYVFGDWAFDEGVLMSHTLSKYSYTNKYTPAYVNRTTTKVETKVETKPAVKPKYNPNPNINDFEPGKTLCWDPEHGYYYK